MEGDGGHCGSTRSMLLWGTVLVIVCWGVHVGLLHLLVLVLVLVVAVVVVVGVLRVSIVVVVVGAINVIG